MKVLFIHRSVGQNIIDAGHLYQAVAKASKSAHLDIVLDDINNNTAPGIPGKDTKPKDYAAYFKNHKFSEDLVVIKSCYPNNAISSDEALTRLQTTYRDLIKSFLAKSTGKLLILTTPPLRPIRTNQAEAKRARQLATWLRYEDLDSRVTVLDLYDLLATPEGTRGENMLSKDYRNILPWDSHPNRPGSRNAALKIASEIVRVLREG